MWIGLRKELKIKAVILTSKMTCKPAYHFIPVAPPETENGVHGNVKSVQHQVSSMAPRLLNILLRKLQGQVLEKFQIFSDMTADYAGFDSGERKLLMFL